MPLQFAFRRENVSALALGVLDLEIRLGFAKFFESPVDSYSSVHKSFHARAAYLRMGF